MRVEVTVVLGTYNRIELLKRCLDAIRASVGSLTYEAAVVDGGSTDGTLEYLRRQQDVHLIEQGELLGAVAAFDAGFARAVDNESPWIPFLNDDDLLLPSNPPAIAGAVELLRRDPKVGAVAFEFDLRRAAWGGFNVDNWGGAIYPNKGVVRREALMAVARAQGDPTGKAFWNRCYHTYAADTEAGLWLWRLGWEVVRGVGLRIHDVRSEQVDLAPLDPLQERNQTLYHSGEVKQLGFEGGDEFCRRWGHPDQWAYHREDAVKFGGLVR